MPRDGSTALNPHVVSPLAQSALFHLPGKTPRVPHLSRALSAQAIVQPWNHWLFGEVDIRRSIFSRRVIGACRRAFQNTPPTPTPPRIGASTTPIASSLPVKVRAAHAETGQDGLTKYSRA